MAKRDTDPVLQQVVRAIDESGQAAAAGHCIGARYRAGWRPDRPADVLRRAVADHP
jgi:hypothetical protein